MQLTTITTQTELDNMATEWNDLLSCCSASHVPFLRHEYLSSWWRTLGGGEWEHGNLFTIVARHDDGQLIGIAPMFFHENLGGEPALLLLGSIEISDYLDMIINPQELPAFSEALFAFLDSDQAPPWKILDFYNILETSPTLPALKTAAQGRGWEYNQENLQPCPVIPLPGNWETYLAGIKKKQRHEIRRKIRRAENHEPPVRWYFVEDEATLDSEIDDFLDLMAVDPEKDRFLTRVMRSQMRAAVHAAYQADWLQLAFLEVGGKKAAGYLNFDFNGHIWVYNSGINLEYSHLSPGWVLLGHLLKWANENQREAFDFMRGDEPYKYRFGAINRYVVRSTVTRKE